MKENLKSEVLLKIQWNPVFVQHDQWIQIQVWTKEDKKYGYFSQSETQKLSQFPRVSFFLEGFVFGLGQPLQKSEITLGEIETDQILLN